MNTTELKQLPKPKNVNVLGRLISSVHITESCWNWTRYRNEWGYGRLRVNGEKQLAHRVSFQLFRGPIPAGMLVCHTCDNPACINPSHLFLGTNQDNVTDCMAKGRHRGILNSPFTKGHKYYGKH